MALLSGCALFGQSDVIVIRPSWQKERIKIVGCKPVVEYSARGFNFKGFVIPIPQLGGNVNVGEFTYKPQTLNTLYRNVAILDALRLAYCGDRVVAAQTSRAAFEACNERIQQQEEKIAYLAMSATQGEAAVEEAIHKYGTASPAAPTPKDPEKKKLDNVAAADAKEKAKAATGAPSSASPSPAPPATKTALPAHVAAVVKDIPAETLLKMARRPGPSSSPQPH